MCDFGPDFTPDPVEMTDRQTCGIHFLHKTGKCILREMGGITEWGQPEFLFQSSMPMPVEDGNTDKPTIRFDGLLNPVEKVDAVFDMFKHIGGDDRFE